MKFLNFLLFITLIIAISCKKTELKSPNKEVVGQPTIIGLTNVTVNYDSPTYTYNVTVPYGTVITNLVFNISVSQGATILPNPSSPRDYSNPVIYTVTAQDGSTQTYIIKVIVQTPPKSTEKQIIEFKFEKLNPVVIAAIDQSTRKITATIPANANITDLTPTIRLSAKATVSPNSGITQNFTNAVNYTVSAEDGSIQIYEVKITKDVVISQNQGKTPLGQDRPTGVFINISSWANSDSLLSLYARKVRELTGLSKLEVPDKLDFRISNGQAIEPTLKGALQLLDQDIVLGLIQTPNTSFNEYPDGNGGKEFIGLAKDQTVFQKLSIKPNRAGYDNFFWYINNKFATGGSLAKPGIAFCLGALGDNGKIDPYKGFEIIGYFHVPSN